MRKLIIYLFFIAILLYDNNINCIAQNKYFFIEIEQSNVRTGKTAKYTLHDQKINVYKKVKEKKYQLVHSKKIEEKKVEAIYAVILNLINNSKGSDTLLSNSEFLDGFTWSISIDIENKRLNYKVCNCFHQQTDIIIQLLNEEIKEKKRLIFPSGIFFTKAPCLLN